MRALEKESEAAARRRKSLVLICYHSMTIRFALRFIARWLGFFLCGLLTACSASADERCTLLNSNFEQFEGWISPLPAFLTTEHVHSGRYACFIGQGAEYGPVYGTTLDACPFLPHKLRLSGWVYLPSGHVSTVLVVAINCHGRRPDIWEGLVLDEVVTRYQVWVPVQKHISLPDDLLPTDEIKLSIWHNYPNAEAAFLDDLKIEGWE